MSAIHEIQDTPLYNMKAVARETGLKPMTIRSWERRYGLPRPSRSEGGHRVYSQHDIDLLRWLQARLKDGLTIRHAAERWNQLAAQGIDPLADEEESQSPPLTVSTSVDLEMGDQIHGLRDIWVSACMAFDQQKADQVLTEAFARFPPELVCTQLLRGGLAEIGEGWYRGEVTVQQEHFASALAVRRLETLIAASPRPVSTKRILVCAAPEDDHTFGILLLSYLLLRHGWDVVYLGANTPLEELAETIQQVKPSLVILAAQRLYTASNLLDVVQSLQNEDVVIGYGGSVFNHMPSLQQVIPGHFLGESLEEALQRVQKLLAERPSTLPMAEVKEGDRQALRQYLGRRSLIESHVWGLFLAEGKPTEHLGQINVELAQTIIAALKLGVIEQLDSEVAWFKHVAANYHISQRLAGDYLRAYHQASRIHLGETASIITDWLGQIVPDGEES